MRRWLASKQSPITSGRAPGFTSAMRLAPAKAAATKEKWPLASTAAVASRKGLHAQPRRTRGSVCKEGTQGLGHGSRHHFRTRSPQRRLASGPILLGAIFPCFWPRKVGLAGNNMIWAVPSFPADAAPGPSDWPACHGPGLPSCCYCLCWCLPHCAAEARCTPQSKEMARDYLWPAHVGITARVGKEATMHSTGGQPCPSFSSTWMMDWLLVIPFRSARVSKPSSKLRAWWASL